MTPSDLSARLRELMEEATPGEWEWQNGCSWWRLGTRAGNGNVICPTTHPIDRHPDLIVSREDRELIVYLKNNAPTIIRLLEAGESVEKALEGLAGAEALKEVPRIVAGWNGPPEKPYAPHPSNLGANIRTTCGRVYKLNEALTAATSALATLRAAREGAR